MNRGIQLDALSVPIETGLRIVLSIERNNEVIESVEISKHGVLISVQDQILESKTLVPNPLATNDQSATKPETPVILKPITNDTAGSFALNATTLRLCQETDIAPNCAQLSVTNAHGTYVVDPATGGVTFTPAKGFKGIATIPYVLSDMNARFANANLFITVSSDASTTPSKANEKDLAKTGTNGAYALGSLAIISAMAGTALVASSQRKQTRA